MPSASDATLIHRRRLRTRYVWIGGDSHDLGRASLSLVTQLAAVAWSELARGWQESWTIRTRMAVRVDDGVQRQRRHLPDRRPSPRHSRHLPPSHYHRAHRQQPLRTRLRTTAPHTPNTPT